MKRALASLFSIALASAPALGCELPEWAENVSFQSDCIIRDDDEIPSLVVDVRNTAAGCAFWVKDNPYELPDAFIPNDLAVQRLIDSKGIKPDYFITRSELLRLEQELGNIARWYGSQCVKIPPDLKLSLNLMRPNQQSYMVSVTPLLDVIILTEEEVKNGAAQLDGSSFPLRMQDYQSGTLGGTGAMYLEGTIIYNLPPRRSSESMRLPNRMPLAHEMAHAVVYGYLDMEAQPDRSNSWFFEGLAQGLADRFVQDTEGRLPAIVPRWDTRRYVDHILETPGIGSLGKYYGTRHFWYYVFGERLSVNRFPSLLTFLRDEPLKELEVGVDEWLRQEGISGGLTEAYEGFLSHLYKRDGTGEILDVVAGCEGLPDSGADTIPSRETFEYDVSVSDEPISPRTTRCRFVKIAPANFPRRLTLRWSREDERDLRERTHIVINDREMKPGDGSLTIRAGEEQVVSAAWFVGREDRYDRVEWKPADFVLRLDRVENTQCAEEGGADLFICVPWDGWQGDDDPATDSSESWRPTALSLTTVEVATIASRALVKDGGFGPFSLDPKQKLATAKPVELEVAPGSFTVWTYPEPVPDRTALGSANVTIETKGPLSVDGFDKGTVGFYDRRSTPCGTLYWRGPPGTTLAPSNGASSMVLDNPSGIYRIEIAFTEPCNFWMGSTDPMIPEMNPGAYETSGEFFQGPSAIPSAPAQGEASTPEPGSLAEGLSRI